MIGLGVASTALSNHVKPKLSHILTSVQLQEVLETVSAIGNLSPTQKTLTEAAFDNGYKLQLWIMMGFALATFPVALFTFRRHPVPIEVAGMGGGERAEMRASDR